MSGRVHRKVVKSILVIPNNNWIEHSNNAEEEKAGTIKSSALQKCVIIFWVIQNCIWINDQKKKDSIGAWNYCNIMDTLA